MLVAPVLDGDRRLMGVIQVINNHSGQPFARSRRKAWTQLCKTLAIAFASAGRSRRTSAAGQAKYDDLVADAVLAADELEHCMQQGARARTRPSKTS